MSIRSGLVIAVATLGILGAGWAAPAAAQGAGCAGQKISKQIAKPMKAAMEAQTARKWNEVLAKVKEAEAVPGPKSAFDLYYMAEIRGYAYHNLRQDGEAARELESGLGSPCMPEAKKLDRYKNLVGLYAALRNYPKVIEYSSRALKLSRDPDMQVALAQAYYQSGNNKEAARVMNELLDQNGVKPKEQQLVLVVNACKNANDNNCVSRAYEKLVTYYPKPEYWSNLMTAITKTQLNDVQQLNFMRLGVHVKVLKRPDDFKEMAQLGLEEKLACESQSVLETGFTNKVFVEKRDVDVNTRLLAAAKKECAADKAALPANETAAKAAASGDALVKVGAQYLAAGDPAKAAAAIQAGIAKGNLAAGDPPNQAQRSDEAYILLGIAQLRNNNKDAAKKAFGAVKKDPTMVRIAKLWGLDAA
ncbi:MAG TPA: hypothetical protein VFX92_02300 [Candidatus Krumholzibacteria bacterium]|nr:hypothetical protein [Candidatus Krumholzibacteria bacterium]